MNSVTFCSLLSLSLIFHEFMQGTLPEMLYGKCMELVDKSLSQSERKVILMLS